MQTGYIIIDETGYPVGIIEHLNPWLEMLSGLSIKAAFDDDGTYRLYNPSGDLLARVHKIEIGF